MRPTPPDWPRALAEALVQEVIREWPGAYETLRALGVDPATDGCRTLAEVEAEHPGTIERIEVARVEMGAL